MSFLKKLIFACVLLALAYLMGMYLSNYYTIIECNNTHKTCKTYTHNPFFQTTTQHKAVDVSAKQGTSWQVLGVGKHQMQYVSCKQRQQNALRRDGTKKKKTSYILTSIAKSGTMEWHVIREYTSQTLCEVDRMAIQTYLNSDSKDPLIYKAAGSWLRYLWYIPAILFVLLAFIVLFKGKVLSEAQVKQTEELMSPEELEQLHSGIRNIISHVSKLDRIGAEKVNQAEKKLNNRLDIPNQDSKNNS